MPQVKFRGQEICNGLGKLLNVLFLTFALSIHNCIALTVITWLEGPFSQPENVLIVNGCLYNLIYNVSYTALAQFIKIHSTTVIVIPLRKAVFVIYCHMNINPNSSKGLSLTA